MTTPKVNPTPKVWTAYGPMPASYVQGFLRDEANRLRRQQPHEPQYA